MMMEKWHSAYEENTHVPFIVRFPQKRHQVPGGMRQISDPTNHADILPTILGLAGIDGDERNKIQQTLSASHKRTLTPVGADLSGLILGTEKKIYDEAGKEREGVLFMTHDTISEPISKEVAETDIESEDQDLTSYDVFLRAVEEVGDVIEPGSVIHPCLVHSVVHKDNWKLVRYFGPEDNDEDNQFELYDLNTDPNEQHNLLVFDGAYPTVIPLIPEKQTLSTSEIEEKAGNMMVLLTKLEKEKLKLPVRAQPL